MTDSTMWLVIAAVTGLLFVGAPSESAVLPSPDQGADTARAAGQTDTTTVRDVVIYRRERFVYPSGNRQNPFVSLLTLEETGPQFNDLEVVGIIFGGSAGSVATLIDRTNDKRYPVRRGDTVGNARVVEIRPDAVVFNVTEFGVSRTETLRIRKEEERG